MKRIEKKKEHAFGKDTYLLGKLNNEYIWLEAARFDCGWYWGFGYIEVYTNQENPSRSKDTSSHSHFKGLLGKKEYYDHEKGCFRTSNEYFHHLNELPEMEESVLTDKESWELSDLMESFYTLKDAAGIFNHGDSSLTTVENPCLKNEKIEKEINEVLLPKIFERIYQILSPKE